MVGVVGQKLIQELPVGPVQLDAVEAGLARSPGGRDEGFYDLGYPLVVNSSGRAKSPLPPYISILLPLGGTDEGPMLPSRKRFPCTSAPACMS